MVFSSPIFLFAFLPLVLLSYYLAPAGARNAILLVASLFFYAWGEVAFVGVMLVTILANYLAGLAIGSRRGPAARAALAAGIVADLTLLASFKYGGFLVENLNVVLGALGLGALPVPQLHLPLGVSFFTFQAMSYLVDVYRGESAAQRNPWRVALYIALFPQLIAGPIVRYHDVAAQLVRRHHELDGFAYGVERFIYGLGKKLLIADPLGEVADAAFGVPAGELGTALAWIGLACYTLQIYFDFSGYSDMAIGLGRMFGFRFLENFDYPYVAQSIREFWRRWHISLSTWFRDYLYIPLGGNRISPARTYGNLVVVFLLCGLWHGASWNFVIWGALHGTFLALERAGLERVLAGLWRPLRHAYTLAVVTLAWVFFRAEDLPGAVRYLAALSGVDAAPAALHPWQLYLGHEALLALALGVLLSTPVYRRLRGWETAPIVGMWQWAPGFAVPMVVLGLSLLRLAAGSYNPFIYFRF